NFFPRIQVPDRYLTPRRTGIQLPAGRNKTLPIGTERQWNQFIVACFMQCVNRVRIFIQDDDVTRAAGASKVLAFWTEEAGAEICERADGFLAAFSVPNLANEIFVIGVR